MRFLIHFAIYLCEALIVCIFARSLMSWGSPNPKNPFVNALYRLTEPMLAPLRKIIPKFGPADFAPFVAIVILFIIVEILFFVH